VSKLLNHLDRGGGATSPVILCQDEELDVGDDLEEFS